MSENPKNNPGISFGAAFYPEHWAEERWAADIELMVQAKFSVVRLAEFAWSTLEPKPGHYQFDWLDRAIDQLAQAGIKTVLGTPTAAPPAWLIDLHPEILPTDESGNKVQFGNRCHYCVTSSNFHQATRSIVEAMAQHFGKSEHVIGWQIDNEFNRICYCDNCRHEFHLFLQERYKTLDNLNRRWSTAYWSQTYTDWRQIPLPVGPHNPGLMLAFKRFTTSVYRNFLKIQVDTLRPTLQPDVWITHNFMNWFGAFDHYELSQDLDLVSWDWYVGTGKHNYLESGAAHDLHRGFKNKHFWLMETQPGHVNWKPVNTTLDKNEARAMAYHAIAHGADAVLYWQWRSAYGGQEQYHGTLLDQSGQPRPFFAEARRLGRELARLNPLLSGSQVHARVAIIHDYPSRWSIEFQPHHEQFNYINHLLAYYRSLAGLNIPVDIIPQTAPLDEYRLVIVPGLVCLSEEFAARLKKFVENTGHLIVTLRSGVKDADNALQPVRPPAFLSEFLGVEVEEYYALETPSHVKGTWFEGRTQYWAERLKIVDDKTTAIATYTPSNGWLDNQPAITTQVKPGPTYTYYVGAWLDDYSLKKFLEQVLIYAGVRTLYSTPHGVEWSVRNRQDGQEIHFLINHTARVQTVHLPWKAYDHLSKQQIESQCQLAGYAVAILTRENENAHTGNTPS